LNGFPAALSRLMNAIFCRPLGQGTKSE
jgi:hypothetical protein